MGLLIAINMNIGNIYSSVLKSFLNPTNLPNSRVEEMRDIAK